MDYTKKTVRSRPGLTQEEALLSLQGSPFYSAGTRIASITHRADRWVAVLDIPKTAGPFPPGGDDEGGEPAPPKNEGGPEESESDSDSSDSPDSGGDSGPGSPKGDGPPSKGDKPGSDAQVVQILTQILHALQGGPPMGGLGGPDDLGPGADPLAPPPHGGPAGGPGAAPPKGPGAMGAGRPLKPGEVPNKPGVTPVGSPAFSHTRQANPLDPMGGGAPMGGGPLSPGPNPMDPGGMGAPNPGPTSQGGTGTCAHCGGMLGPDGSCPTCGGSYMASALRQHIAKIAGRSASASVTCPPEVRSVKQAKMLIESAASGTGYKIKQIKRTRDGRLAALLSVR